MKQEENKRKEKERIVQVLEILQKTFPHKGVLDRGTDVQMLIAVVLSARTKDSQVLKVLPRLFAAFPTIKDLAQATVEEIEPSISSIGLYKSKAKHIAGLARILHEKYQGKLPQTMEELTALPGVGRKTASVMLATRCNSAAIAVDTHVFRIAQRLGFARAGSVGTLEKKLLRAVPVSVQPALNTVMVPFGRTLCTPQSPRCFACPVAHLCPYPKKNLVPSVHAQELLKKAFSEEEVMRSVNHKL